jgi:hypothetical protein
MPTTSLKLSPEIKSRAIEAARQQGLSLHAFMVAAVERATLSAEQRAALIGSAEEARAEMETTGKGYDAQEVHTYLRGRIAGKNPARPAPKPWRD